MPSAKRNEWLRKYRSDMRMRVIQKLGGRCANPACQWLNSDGSRGCSDAICLQIDHVYDDGAYERRILKMSAETFLRAVLKDEEGRYQLLCANCNWIKKHYLQIQITAKKWAARG